MSDQFLVLLSTLYLRPVLIEPSCFINLNIMQIRKTTLYWLCTFLMVQLLSTTFAQQRYAGLDVALQSGGKLSGAGGPQNINWIEGGERFSYRGGNGVIKVYNPADQTESVLFEAANYKFPGTETPFKYSAFEWSSDSKFILFQTNFRSVWRNSGNADYYLFSLSDKQLKLVAKDAYTAQLSPDGRKVCYEREGNLFVLELASQKTTQLTKDAQKSFYNGRFGWVYEEEFGLVQAWDWSPDSRYIAFWQTDERSIPIYQFTDYSSFDDVYEEVPYPRVGDPVPTVRIGIADTKSGKSKWVKTELGDGYFPRIYWTSEAGQLAVSHLNRKQNHLKLFFADAATGNARLVMEEQSEAWIDVFDFFAGILHYFFFPEGAKEFFWLSERDGWAHIYRYDYSGKLLNQVTKGNWEVVKINQIDAKNQRIYFTATEQSPLERHLYSVNFDGSGMKRLTETAGKHNVNFSTNGDYYLNTYSNINLPKQVELRSVSKGLLKKLESNEKVGEFVKSNFYAPRELMQFTTSDGQKIDFYAIKPQPFDPAKKYPVIFDIYGGPGAQSVYNEFETNTWHQYMAQEGFVVVSVNNRGSGGYGEKFQKIVYANLGEWESKDFAETAKHLATLPWVDGARIAIKGHSYGGYSSSYTMLAHPGVFKVAIVAAPIIDWRNYDNIYTERYMGLVPENNAQYDKSASTTYADKLDGKMLIVHSTMDDNVHVRNTFQLVKSLIDKGKDADLRIYPPGNHGVAYSWPSYLLLQKQYMEYLKANL